MADLAKAVSRARLDGRSGRGDVRAAGIAGGLNDEHRLQLERATARASYSTRTNFDVTGLAIGPPSVSAGVSHNDFPLSLYVSLVRFFRL